MYSKILLLKISICNRRATVKQRSYRYLILECCASAIAPGARTSRWSYLAILNLMSLTFGDGSRPSHAFTNKEAAASARALTRTHTCACGGAMRVRERLCVASWFPTGFDICPRPDPPSASLARGAARDTSSPGPPPPIVGTPLPESR